MIPDKTKLFLVGLMGLLFLGQVCAKETMLRGYGLNDSGILAKYYRESFALWNKHSSKPDVRESSQQKAPFRQLYFSPFYSYVSGSVVSMSSHIQVAENFYYQQSPPPSYSSLNMGFVSLNNYAHVDGSKAIELPSPSITTNPYSAVLDLSRTGAISNSLLFVRDQMDVDAVGIVRNPNVTIEGNNPLSLVEDIQGTRSDILRNSLSNGSVGDNRYVPPTEITNIEVYDNSVILWINAFNLNGAIVEVSYDGNHWHSLSIPQENVIGISYEGALQGKVIVPLTTNASRALYRLRLPRAL